VAAPGGAVRGGHGALRSRRRVSMAGACSTGATQNGGRLQRGGIFASLGYFISGDVDSKENSLERGAT